MLSVSRLKTKIFRNNTAKAWVGSSSLRYSNGDVLVRSARVLHCGLTKGSSDLIGWTKIKITKSMVGKEVAVFTAIEVKTQTGKVTEEQKSFIDAVKKDGGMAGVARTPGDAANIISGYLDESD